MTEQLTGQADQPSWLRLSIENEIRVAALPQDLTGSLDSTRSILDLTLHNIFDTDKSGVLAPGKFLGATPEVVAMVQEGLISTLEEFSESPHSETTARRVIFPVHDYLTDPDPLIVEVMKKRTDELKDLFAPDMLAMALSGAAGGSKYIAARFKIDHPEFSQVEVSAEGGRSYKIHFKFYETPPTDRDPFSHLDYDIDLDFKDQEDTPELNDPNYPRLMGMLLTVGKIGEDYRFTEQEMFDIPEETKALVSEVYNAFLISVLSNQYKVLNDKERSRPGLLTRLRAPVVFALQRAVEVQLNERMQQIGDLLVAQGIAIDELKAEHPSKIEALPAKLIKTS